ncbi:MAG: hypothetical protein HC904_08410 [Blastochloris sp.]|nr:hypothetical protein [Blastochloris sp.]
MAGISDPFFEMTRQMVADASRLKNVLKELPSLAQKLPQYEPWSTVGKLAGLLTCPDCHANTIRIEGLIHLAVALCKGAEIPRRNDVYIWFNRYAANSSLCRMEDPLEDVFISNVINGNGNHRIFEGIWECNDYWLQCLLRAFVAMPQNADYESMIRNAEALLRISEEIAKRNELKRYCSGGGEAKGAVFIPNPDDLDKYAANVIFSLADLEDIGVKAEYLLPFIWKDVEKSKIIESQLENSPLERHPLLFQGGRYMVALPTSISIAIRRYILEVVASKGNLKQLEHYIFHVQTDQLTDFALSRLGARPWKPELFPEVKRKISINLTYVPFQFDSDKFGLACYIAPPLANTGGTDFANLQQVRREWNEINELIGKAIKCVSADTAFKQGLLLIAIGGLGAAASFPAPKIPAGWNMVSYSVPNLLTLASLPDVNISMLWRLACQEQRFMEKGVELLNPNGDFNLFAAWKASDYDLLPDEAPLTDAPILLAPDINALLESRLRSRIRRDVHAVYRNSPPRWTEVERKNGFASFGGSRDDPFYVSGALARQGQLAGVVEVRDLFWWMVSYQKYVSEMQRSIVYQVWDCFCNWLIPIVRYLDQQLGPIHRTIETQLQFDNLPQWENGRKINGQGLDIPLEWKIEGHVGIITITEQFLRSFAQSQNTAERQIVSALLQYGAVFLGRSISKDELLAARDRIIPLGDARFFHVLAVNDATLSAVEGPNDPYFIKKEVLAEVLQELGFAVAPNSRGTLVGDKKDVRKLVRDAVAHLKQEIINSLKPLNRKVVVQRCLGVIDSIHRNHHTWKISAAALMALANDNEELFGEAQRLESERSGANMAARALIEMALYSCSGEEIPSDILMDEMLARIQQLIRIADYDQAIRADFAHGQISIARSGAFRIQNPYLDHVRYSYTTSEFKAGFSAASKTYAKWHEKEKKESVSLEDQELFDEACQSEFGLDALGMIEVSEALNEYGGSQSLSIF